MLLDEAINDKNKEPFEAAEPTMETAAPETPKYKMSDFLPNLDFILAETGEGSIENYIEHPLNFKGSKGIAQMLRGFTGVCGSLNYAIIDITLGAFETIKEGRAEHETPNRTE